MLYFHYTEILVIYLAILPAGIGISLASKLSCVLFQVGN